MELLSVLGYCLLVLFTGFNCWLLANRERYAKAEKVMRYVCAFASASLLVYLAVYYLKICS